MTHGAGSVGGGGGGWGGGGGYSYSYHHHRHGRKDGDECCGYLCLGVCTLLSYMLCIRRMDWTTRVVIVWVYIVTSMLTVGLILGLGVYGPTTIPAAPTDMRIVDKGVSTLLCEKVRLSSEAPFSSFLLDAPPPVLKNRREVYRVQKSMNIYQDKYEYWGYYLLPGSTIRVESSAFTDIALFVIQGEKKLKKWMKNPHCDGCYLQRMRVPGGFNQVNYTMTATTSDDVYFVYAATYRSMFADDVTATFYVNRTLYDVTDAKRNCTSRFGEDSCDFELELNSRQVVVFHSTNSTTVDSTDTRVECVIRVSMFVVLIGLLPVAFGAALSFALFLFCRQRALSSAYVNM